jgi:hypothetical protein
VSTLGLVPALVAAAAAADVVVTVADVCYMCTDAAGPYTAGSHMPESAAVLTDAAAAAAAVAAMLAAALRG